MADIISSAKRLGRSNRASSRVKTRRAHVKNVANDLSATLAQIAGFADQKAIESENLQAGESLLKEGDDFQEIKDTKIKRISGGRVYVFQTHLYACIPNACAFFF